MQSLFSRFPLSGRHGNFWRPSIDVGFPGTPSTASRRLRLCLGLPTLPTPLQPDATAVIVDTDFATSKLSVQDGDQVIATMHRQHYAKVSIPPGAHNFSAESGTRAEGPGTVAVDVKPGQVIYPQVGGISSKDIGIGAPNVPWYDFSLPRDRNSLTFSGFDSYPVAL
jgi:hypothetical protein